jgi:phage anti-repressor protein
MPSRSGTPLADGQQGAITQKPGQMDDTGRDFSTWAKARLEECGAKEGRDYVTVKVTAKSGENPRGGRPSVEYHITTDIAKHCGMLERNEWGFALRQYFIDCKKMLLAEMARRPVVRAEGKMSRRKLTDALKLRGLTGFKHAKAVRTPRVEHVMAQMGHHFFRIVTFPLEQSREDDVTTATLAGAGDGFDEEGIGINRGLVLFAGPALAADLAVQPVYKAPVYKAPVVAVPTWAGLVCRRQRRLDRVGK